MIPQFLARSAPYTLMRPDVDERDAQDVRHWLLRHPLGGWLQIHDSERTKAAKRLIFMRRLVVDGTVSDGR